MQPSLSVDGVMLHAWEAANLGYEKFDVWAQGCATSLEEHLDMGGAVDGTCAWIKCCASCTHSTLMDGSAATEASARVISTV